MHTISDIQSWVDRLRDFMARTLEDPAPESGEETYNELALEIFGWQTQFNPVLGRLMGKRGRADISHWTQIPAVPTAAFREFEVSCLPPRERTSVFCSSGTTGAPVSRHYHHAASLALYEDSVLHWFGPHLSHQGRLPRPVFLTPPSSQAPHSSLVHMFETIRHKHPNEHALFAGEVDTATGAWQLRMPRIQSLFQLAMSTGEAISVLGTAFNFVQLLDALESDDRTYELPPGSRVMETGGYKGRSRSMPKDELHQAISERLGLPHQHIVCEYGMSELSSQAYDRVVPETGTDSALHPDAFREPPPWQNSEAAGFQFPPWARARIVSPEHGREVAVGEAGLIQVFDLANAWSAMAVQTEDLGVRQEHGFALMGRLPRAEPKGCSLQALTRS